MHRARRLFCWGFTRVELLVILSIIGLLASSLLPVVNRARERDTTASGAPTTSSRSASG